MQDAKNRRFTAAVLLALVFFGGAAPVTAADAALAKAVRDVEPYMLLDFLEADEEKERREELRRSVFEDAKALRRKANEADVAAWREIDRREAWEKLRDERIARLKAALGTFPDPPTDLHLRVTKTIPGDGFEIRNVLFESRPGLHVTANLYVPRPLRESMPGILIVHSHHRPKTQGELQDMGMTWARAGCCVLVMDQLGHGERRSHPFASSSDWKGEFRVSRQDYYFRYVTGMQTHLLGDSLMGWMAWDLMRGVDLLCSMPGVDEDRLILLGAVAGGGDPAGVTAALDVRIDAVVPFNFGGPQPETVFPLPEDAASAFNYFGGGSWESTRNLTRSISGGFPHWLIVASVAPRPLIHAHEFAWDRDNDPVWRRYERIYGDFYGKPQHLGSAKGRGSVRGRPPEATHCTNIGPVHRSQIHPLLEKWFGIEATEYQERLDESELLVLKGTDEEIDPPHAVFSRVGKAKQTGFAESLPEKRERRLDLLRTAWTKLLRDVDPVAKPLIEERSDPGDGIRFTRSALYDDEVDLGAQISVVQIVAGNDRKAKRPTVVWLVRAGLDDVLDQRAETIAAQLEAGYRVVLVEPSGVGLTAPGSDRGRQSNTTGVSSTLLMLGRPQLGVQLRDLRTVLAWLRREPGYDGRFVLWADSLAEVNGPERDVAVPRGTGDEPAIAEPMGHVLALLGGLFEEDVAAIVSMRGGLTSFRSALAGPFVHLPHDVIVPGAIGAGDLGALAAVVEPRRMKFSGRVDASNRLVEPVVPAAELVEWLEETVPPKGE